MLKPCLQQPWIKQGPPPLPSRESSSPAPPPSPSPSPEAAAEDFLLFLSAGNLPYFGQKKLYPGMSGSMYT